MAYGISFTGSNNQMIFDTDNFADAKAFTIQDGHPTSLANGSSVEVPSGSFAFMRVNSGDCYTQQNYDTSNPPKWMLKNVSGQSISYFFMSPMDTVTGNFSSSGGYGLEIYGPPDNNNQQALTFSTTKIANQAISFHRIWDSGSLYDGDNVLGSSMSSSGFYVSCRTSYYEKTLNTGINGNTDIELAINGIEFYTNSILCRNFREISEGGVTEGGDWVNPGGIIVASITT